jgi:hypothetical protein
VQELENEPETRISVLVPSFSNSVVRKAELQVESKYLVLCVLISDIDHGRSTTPINLCILFLSFLFCDSLS